MQKHQASHLHYDFRLEMEGVLKSWAVPKGPSLDPGDKRLAMMVEDHPVSYFDFEGIIPPGNYGAGTVMVWDVGKWEPLGDASEMLKKGDLKFRLDGKKLKGEFVLARMRSRRPGSKGNEWLLIKKRDDGAKPGFDVDKLDYSVLTKRSLAEIAGDAGSAEWESNRKKKVKDAWLVEALARRKKRTQTAEDAEGAVGSRGKSKNKSKSKAATQTTEDAENAEGSRGKSKTKSKTKNVRASSLARKASLRTSSKKKSSESSASSVVRGSKGPNISAIPGARQAPMPRRITPMLATLVDEPFDDAEWLFEVKWDGYRALAYIEDGATRLVSRNQNDLTGEFPELRDMAKHFRAENAIADGEIVALDAQGRPSFSLMQQRTGFREPGRRSAKKNTGLPIQFYAFDLLYLDGYDLMRVELEERKQLLASILTKGPAVSYSEHHVADGKTLYQAAARLGLEGIVAKRRRSCYHQKRTREWLKVKITRRQECVIGGYTEPRGSREHFGSVVLGLYDDAGRLIHVGQAGSGFDHRSHADMWKRLQELRTDKNPFHGKVDATRRAYWVKPELVAEIKFGEWTHETDGGGLKMRVPIFQGLRFDKSPRECVFEKEKPALKEAAQAEAGKTFVE
jgi:bifunctional non-homologous end joining protein LigD